MTWPERAARRLQTPAGLVGIVLAVVPWFPYPGRIVADTKLDLVVDPWGYLGRSQSAWDSHAFFGQLQNQAYGYLFPMGPFFGVGHSLHLPEWVVQRAWWSTVLVVAYVGTYLLCRRLGVGGRRGAVVAAVAFALSPHALTVLGQISIEQWPSAMVPWLVLASLRLLQSVGRERWHAVALLALGCAAIGGVNATATLAAISVAAVFVLTAGVGGLRTFPWFCAAVIAGTAWWAVPLVVLGVYAYPFLDFIETSAITTSVTTVPNILRGTSHWVAYTGGWPAGADLATTRSAIVATTIVALLGMLGVASSRRWAPHSHARTFAVVSLLAGVTAMGVAYGANLGLPFISPFASAAREALDGSLAAFRNVHKLDPMVRLPLCLGLAALVQPHARPSGSTVTWQQRARRAAPAVAVVAVAVSVLPAVGPRLTARDPFEAIPQRWVDAAATVDRLAETQGGATLLAPAARFGEFTWGNTQDDPLEALAKSPVVQRDAIPLGSPGAIRIMDALDGVLRRGAAQPGLLDVLARLGIGRVVVSHDVTEHLTDPMVDPGSLGADGRTEATLRSSGLRLVASSGKGRTRLSVWSTGRRVATAEAFDADSVVGVTGGPEALVTLAATGGAGDGSPAYAIGAKRSALDPARWVQTDTLRRRGLDVSRTIDAQYTATLQPGRRASRRDFPPAGEVAGTTRGFVGLQSVEASSTASPSTGRDVAAALDGDYATAWSSTVDDERPTIDLTLARRTRAEQVAVRLDSRSGAGRVRRVDVTVDGTTTRVPVGDQDTEVSVPVGAAIQRVSVRLVPVPTEPRLPVGIANIGLRGVDSGAVLDLPNSPGTATGSVLLSRDPWSRDSTSGRVDDGRVLARRLELDDSPAVTDVLVTPRTTTTVERLLDGWRVNGPRSGTMPRTRPGAALDGDPATRWTVDYLAGDPSLTVELPRTRTITALEGLGRGNRYTRVKAAVIRDLDSGETRRWSSGKRSFAPLRARRVRITFDLPRRVAYPFRMPDVTMVGAGTPPASNGGSRVDVPCQDGVSVSVGSSRATYTATLTRDELLAGAAVPATPCAGAAPEARPGTAVVRATSSDVLDADTVRLGEEVAPSTPVPRPQTVRWTDRRRDVRVTAGEGAQVVAWHEGYNGGWKATLGGRPLKAVEVDGWRQGFVVPAGTSGVVRATFAPDFAYRTGLVAGGLLVLLMAAVAVLCRPRKRPAAGPLLRVRCPSWAGGALAVLVPTVLGGFGGLALGVMAVSLPRRWQLRVGAAAGALLVIGVRLWPIGRADSLPSVVPQASALLLVALLATTLAPARGGRLRRTLEETPREVGDQQAATPRQDSHQHE